MTQRFEAELAKKGRDWSEKSFAEQPVAFLFEEIAPNETLVDSRIVSVSKREELTTELLAQGGPTSFGFYPLFEGELPLDALVELEPLDD